MINATIFLVVLSAVVFLLLCVLAVSLASSVLTDSPIVFLISGVSLVAVLALLVISLIVFSVGRKTIEPEITVERNLVRTKKILSVSITPEAEAGTYIYQNEEGEEVFGRLLGGTKIIRDSEEPRLEVYEIVTTETQKWLFFYEKQTERSSEYILHLSPTAP